MLQSGCEGDMSPWQEACSVLQCMPLLPSEAPTSLAACVGLHGEPAGWPA